MHGTVERVYEVGSGSRTAISAPGLIDPWGEFLLTLGIWLVNLSVVPVAWRPPPLVFGVELAGLLKYPAVSIGMISWFIGVAVNLAGSIQYPV